MNEAFIFDAIRTPRGKGKKDGSLYEVKPVNLLAGLLTELQRRNDLDTAAVDDVVMGVVSPIGEQGSVLPKVAALKAQYLTRDEVPAELVDAERVVLEKKTLEEGKPEAAVTKIVEGRIGGFFKEIVLLEQESVTEAKKSVKTVLDDAGTTLKRFARFEIGA